MTRSHRDPDVLFADGELFEWLRERMNRMVAEVDRLPEERLVSTPLDDLVEHFREKFGMEMVVVNRESITVDHHGDVTVPRRDYGREITARVHEVRFSVPFTGDPELFRYQGSTFLSMHPRARVQAQELHITVRGDQVDPDAFRKQLDQQLRMIEQWLGGVRPMVDEHNAKVANEARDRIGRLRQGVLKRRSVVESLGYPFRSPVANEIQVPLTRKRITPGLPPVTGGLKPEPAISEEDYETILSTMHHMSLVMERSPGPFVDMDEEGIRTHFLVQLNGLYEGAATGETFNANGKTDILIRVQDENVFIAECKFWKGPDGMTKALDQLMGYLTWRDTKCALVIFARDVQPTTVLAKVPDTVKRHPLFKQERPVANECWFRAVLGHPEDANREALVTVMVFHVPGGTG